MDRADQMLNYYPCCRKTVKWTKKLVSFLLHIAALNSFILFKKYTTNQNEEGNGYAFKDFILEFVQKITEQEEREDEKDSTIELLASTSTASAPLPHK
jgi:hypothetical protein